MLEYMKTSGLKPDMESYNIFVQHVSKSKDLKAITDIIQEMQALGITGNVYTTSILLVAVYPVRSDAVELVLALLWQTGVQIDVPACNSILDHLVWLLSDDVVAAALLLLDYMETQPTIELQPKELLYI